MVDKDTIQNLILDLECKPTHTGALELFNKDGTKFDPPENPLTEKLDTLYHHRGNGERCLASKYSMTCVLCTSNKCYHNSNFEVPDEDQAAFKEHQLKVYEYIIAHNMLKV